MPQKIGDDSVNDHEVAKRNWNSLPDSQLHDIAMAQLSCLDDYSQQLSLHRQQLSQLQHKKTECEQQVTSSERVLRERLQRISDKRKRLDYLKVLKEQALMKIATAATLAIDVEKLKERCTAKECHLKDLIGEVERLTVQQQNLQQEMNAKVVSLSLLSADVNRLTDDLSWTDECNIEYEAQLNVKYEKMRQQQKHLEALQQSIVQLNHQLESHGKKPIGTLGAVGMKRQNINYHSLPLGAKLRSLTNPLLQQNEQRADTQRYKDPLSMPDFDITAYEDSATTSGNSCVDPFSGNSITMFGDFGSSNIFAPVSSAHWGQQTSTNKDVNHSESLRSTSYRMIQHFGLQQADMQHSKQTEHASCDFNTGLLGFSQKSADDCFPVAAGSVHVRPPLTLTEDCQHEQTSLSADVVSFSLPPKVDDYGLDISSPLSQLSVNTNGHSEPVSLPDVVGFLSDNITSPNVIAHNKVSSDGAFSTLSVPAASKIPPPVAQKPKSRYPYMPGYSAVSSEGNVITSTPLDSVNAVVQSPKNTDAGDNEMLRGTSFTLRQDLLSQKLQLNSSSDEAILNKATGLNQKAFSLGDGQDMTESVRIVNKPIYKPSVIYPVRRRRLSAAEDSEISSTFPSSEVHVKEDTASAAESSSVSSEGNILRVQTVKKKFRAGISRRVQFEPLALLLDAALEGEIDLLQATLKVCDVSAANDEGITALHNAICAGHLGVAEYLVNYGCDVNAPDNDGWTPLHCAASCNNTDIAQLLVQHGACVFATTLSDHETPSEKCEPDEDNYESCLHFLQDVEAQMRKPGAAVYAAFDYSAENSDELSFSVSDQLIVVQCNDDVETQWWWCQLNEHEGYVPQNLIALHPRNVLPWTAETESSIEQ